MAITCKNCTHSFDGNFCNNCGQTANTHEINFHSIVHEIQHSLLHIDKGILYTTKELFLRPGETIRGYLDGKRVKHFKPFAFIFILSTIYALLTKLSHKSTNLTDFLEGFYSGSTKSGNKNNFGILADIFHWMSNHYAYTTLLFIPLMSLASYFCFHKVKYNYFEHLILNSFIAGQRTVVFLIILPFTYFVTDKGLDTSIDTMKAYLSIGLTFWSYFLFFNTYSPIKKILLTLLTYVLMVVFIFVLIVIIAFISNMLM